MSPTSPTILDDLDIPKRTAHWRFWAREASIYSHLALHTALGKCRSDGSLPARRVVSDVPTRSGSPDWGRRVAIVDLNLHGDEPLWDRLFVHRGAPIMKQQRAGKVITVSSV